jgi:membrane protease YdiL (CAAX protease family)
VCSAVRGDRDERTTRPSHTTPIVTRARPFPPAWTDAARAAVPALLVVVAAALPWTRPFVLALLVGGTAVALGRDAPVRWAWAAVIPAAVNLAWGLLAAPERGPLAASACADPASPVAMWRLGQAVVVLGVVVALARVLHADGASIWCRPPARHVLRLALLAFVAATVSGVALGAVLAGPFFGPFRLDLSNPAAFLPALVFAVSNGTMEEVAYRGVLMGWLARVGGLWPAVAFQAVAFGLAHASGADVGGSPLLLFIGMALAGLLAGIVTVRTRSLALTIAAHVGFDVCLYLGLACRLPT